MELISQNPVLALHALGRVLFAGKGGGRKLPRAADFKGDIRATESAGIRIALYYKQLLVPVFESRRN
jgi:hypothetical protein